MSKVVSALNPLTFDKGTDKTFPSYFYSLVLELFLPYSISYLIVPRAPSFLHRFLFSMIVAKGIGPKSHKYSCYFVLESFLLYFVSYPIVLHAIVTHFVCLVDRTAKEQPGRAFLARQRC